MNALYTGVYNLYASGGDLYDALYVDAEYVGMYLANVPQGAEYPFCTYGLVGRAQDWGFSETHESVMLYFNVYTETGQTAAGVLLDDLTTLYDDAALTVTGWGSLRMLREAVGSVNDEDRDPPIYGYHVEYEVLLEKAR